MKILDLNDLYAKAPFSARTHAVCTLKSDKGREVREVRVMVQYPLASSGRIVGHVLETETKWHELTGLMNDGGNHQLDGNDINDSETTLFSDNFGSHSRVRDRHVGIPFGSLTVTGPLPLRKHASLYSRSLKFFLVGPETIWTNGTWPKYGHRGNLSFGTTAIDIATPHDQILSCSIYSDTLVDDFEDNDFQGTVRSIPVIELVTKRPASEFSDDNFVALGRGLVDDLLLLGSLASRGLCAWSRYELTLPENRMVRHVRSTRDIKNRVLDHDDLLVDPNRRKEFFETSLPLLHEMRSKWTKIDRIIHFYAGSCESNDLELRFAGFMWALDALVQLVNGDRKLLRAREEEALRLILDDAIEAEVKDKKAQLIYKKAVGRALGPSLKHRIQQVIADRDIQWNDLYPEGEKLSLPRTRGQLFHELDYDLGGLTDETIRTQSLLERLLLDLIGWKDYSRSPDSETRYWLTEDAEKRAE